MRHALRAVALLVAASACTTSDTVTCADGVVCPAGTRCVATTSAQSMPVELCVDPASLAPCTNKEDREPCVLGDTAGTCHGGACFASECGNQLLDLTEACDDGNSNSGDGCAADCLSNETCGNGITDLAQGEQCDDGDRRSHDGCSSTCRAETPTWYRVVDALSPLSAAYDENRHHTVTMNLGQTVVLREWEGLRWHELPAVFPPRSGSRIAFDQTGGALVLFAGVPSDTWLFDRSGWHQMSVTIAPPPRSGSALAYDATHHRVVLFGGSVSVQLATSLLSYNDTWSWDGVAKTWSPLTTSMPPSARGGSALVHDDKRGVLVLLGGSTDRASFNDLWELDGNRWTRRQAELPPAIPLSSFNEAGAWDPVNQRTLFVRGDDHQVWEWDGASWTQMASMPDPGAPFDGVLTTDRDRQRVVVIRADGVVFEFDGSSWLSVGNATSNTSPGALGGSAVASDPAHREFLLVGGTTTGAPAQGTNRTWRWAGAWTEISSTGAPSPRSDSHLAYDPVHDEYVVFGGLDTAGNSLGDTFVLRPRASWAWSQASPATSPNPRSGGAMAWDPAHQQVVLVGGATGRLFYSSDTWTWDGTAWTPRDVTEGFLGRTDASLAYDPHRQRLVLFGGLASFGGYFDDTWTWTGTAWEPLVSAVRPPGRAHARLVLDAARGNLVLVGGEGDQGLADDLWELTASGWSYVPASGAPPSRTRHAAASSVDEGGVDLLGGEDVMGYLLYDRWRLRWDAQGAVDETCRSAEDSDGDGAAGCADPDCAYRCLSCGDLVCQPALEGADTCPGDCM